MISVKRLKSIRSAIQVAKRRLGQDHDRNRPLFTAWGVEGDREIGSFYNYKRKIKVLDVECGKEVILPCDVVAVIGVIFGDLGCECSDVFRQGFRYYSNASYNDGFYSFGAYTMCTLFEIQDGRLIFLSPLPLPKVTVEVLCYETDGEGLPMISENHVRAVGQYIELQWSLRSKHVPNQLQISPQECDRMDAEWHRLCRLARANDGEVSQTERAQIVAMINDPLSGYKTATWMYNDVYYR